MLTRFFMALGLLALGGLAAFACSSAPDHSATDNKRVTVIRTSDGSILVPGDLILKLKPHQGQIINPGEPIRPQIDLGPLPPGSVRREFNGLPYYVVPMMDQPTG